MIIVFCKIYNLPLIIESTSAQVNQMGGYTNYTPKKFKELISKICKQKNFRIGNIILGGDHIGPLPWKNKNSNTAIKNSKILIKDYLQAGYKKIHIDTSHILKNDRGFNKKKFLSRSFKLLPSVIKSKKIILSLGTEVPPPGGSFKNKYITKFIELQKELNQYLVFLKKYSFNKSFAFVIEPGMNFNGYKITKPKLKNFSRFKKFSEKNNFFYEAHSCDYQSTSTLKKLVKNNFKFLKVGPELTYFYSRAIFKMEQVENENIFKKKSDITCVLLEEMMKKKEYWINYYSNNFDKSELINSRLDRIRYYWSSKKVESSLNVLEKNINSFTKKKFFKLFKIPLKYKNSLILKRNFDILIYFYLSNTLKKFYKAVGFKFN